MPVLPLPQSPAVRQQSSPGQGGPSRVYGYKFRPVLRQIWHRNIETLSRNGGRFWFAFLGIQLMLVSDRVA